MEKPSGQEAHRHQAKQRRRSLDATRAPPKPAKPVHVHVHPLKEQQPPKAVSLHARALMPPPPMALAPSKKQQLARSPDRQRQPQQPPPQPLLVPAEPVNSNPAGTGGAGAKGVWSFSILDEICGLEKLNKAAE